MDEQNRVMCTICERRVDWFKYSLQDTDSNNYCKACYESVAAELRKGVFNEIEALEVIEKVTELQKTYRKLINLLKQNILYEKADKIRYLQGIIKDEQEFCINNYASYRNTVGLSESISMMKETLKKLPNPGVHVKDEEYIRNIEPHYYNGLNCKYWFKILEQGKD